MHINRLEIENFKGISKLEIEPSKINLFVGRNNTCKSTILESVVLSTTAQTGFTDALGESILERLVKYRKHLSSWIKEDATKARITSSISKEIRELILAYVEKGFPKDLLDERSKRKFLNTRETSSLENFVIQGFASLEDYDVYERIIKNALKKELKKQDIEYTFEYLEDLDKLILITNVLNKKLTNIYIVFSEPVFEDTDEFIIASSTTSPSNLYYYSWAYRPDIITIHNTCAQRGILPQLLEDIKTNFRDLIDFRTVESELYVFLENIQEPIPITFMGDGFKSILITILLSALTKDGILVLEEPEATLHPGYIELTAEHLVKAARGNNTQLFISTHSSEFIRSMLDYAGDDIRIFRMHKRGDNIGYTIFEGEDAARKVKDIEIDLRGI